MSILKFLTAAATLAAGLACCQSLPGASVLGDHTAIPIVFTGNIDANHVQAGDAVEARTVQAFTLANGQAVPAGAQVLGHVVFSTPFHFDRTPYAKQKESTLSIHFDRLVNHGRSLPISVSLRAIADPVSSWSSQESTTLEDTTPTRTQIGGDQLTPSQNEIISRDGDVVGYQRRGGVFARLIASPGKTAEGCDASDTEQSVSIFSASACGLYGFGDVLLTENGRRNGNGTFVLASQRGAVKIWKNSSALLEAVATEPAVAAR